MKCIYKCILFIEGMDILYVMGLTVLETIYRITADMSNKQIPVFFQGFRTASKTIAIIKTVGISFITLKNLGENVFLSIAKNLRHLESDAWMPVIMTSATTLYCIHGCSNNPGLTNINHPPKPNDTIMAGFIINLSNRLSIILSVSEVSEPGTCMA